VIALSVALASAITVADYIFAKSSLGGALVFPILLFASAVGYVPAVVFALVAAGVDAAVAARASNNIHLINRTSDFDIAVNASVLAASFVAVVTLFDRLRGSFVRNAALERGAELSAALQAAYAPAPLPVRDDFALDALYAPAQTEFSVGGDWYDVLVAPGGRLLLCVGDVTGHGVGAALDMGRIRQSILTAVANTADAGEILRRANRAILFQNRDFATTFVAFVDAQTLELSYANAGHPAPLVVSADGRVRSLAAHGPLLGAIAEANFPEAFDRLAPGDMLLRYTDGLLEFDRRIADAEARLARVAADVARAPTLDGGAALLRRRVLEGATQTDDIVIVLARFAGRAA